MTQDVRMEIRFKTEYFFCQKEIYTSFFDWRSSEILRTDLMFIFTLINTFVPNTKSSHEIHAT